MNPLELQKLVDGELSPQERAQLLRAFDHSSNPEVWRSVALAFIEDQVFRDCIQTESSLVMECVPPRESSQEPTEEGALQVNLNKTNELTKASNRNQQAKRWLGWMALAACTMIAGWIGGSWSTNRSKLSPSSNLAATQNPQREVQSPEEVTLFRPVGNLAIVAEDTDGTSDGPQSTKPTLELPVYEVRNDQAEQLLAAQAQSLARIKEEYKRRGYDFNAQTQFIESKLPDGRSLLVPAHQFQIRNVTY